MKKSSWWKSNFNDAYLKANESDFTRKKNELEVNFIIKALNLKNNQKILGCIIARHSHRIRTANNRSYTQRTNFIIFSSQKNQNKSDDMS